MWPVVGQLFCISSQGTDKNWQEQTLNNETCLKKFISQRSWKLEPKCIVARSDEKIIEDGYPGESERLMYSRQSKQNTVHKVLLSRDG